MKKLLEKFWNWIIEKRLKDIIDYVKKVVGDGKAVAADVKNLGGWLPFILNLLKDLVEGMVEINAMPATKGAASGGKVEKVYRTKSAQAILEKKGGKK
jgi:hypothetical protein